MAEVLGVAASIASLLDVTVKAINYVRSAKGASQSRDLLLERLTTTHSLLIILQDLAKDGKPRSTFSLLQTPLTRLSEVVKDLINRLNRSKSRQIVGALAWPFKESEVQEYMSLIDSQKSLFILALQNDEIALATAIKEDTAEVKKALEGVTEGVDSLRLDLETHTQRLANDDSSREERLKKKEYAEVVQWLSSEPFWSQQADTLKMAQPGTGGWLFEHPTFKSWLVGDGAVLWCHGIPGAGKTVLSSIIIDRLRDPRLSHTPASTSITLWIYCNYRSHTSQSVDNLFAALLSQVMQQLDIIPSAIRQCYMTHSTRASRPDAEELLPLIKRLIEPYDHVFIIVDGLDESPVQEEREELMENIRSLGTHVQTLVTSRPVGDIKAMFENDLKLEIRATDGDISRYIDGRMTARLRRFSKRDPQFRDLISAKIIQAAHGMFLLAKLHLTSINQMDNPQDVEDALDSLPTTYENTYDEALQRIKDGDPFQSRRAFQVFSWLSFAMEPLTVEQMRHALAISPKRTAFNERALPDEEDILSVCGGLVIVDDMLMTVRLVHYTIQEYFIERRGTLFPRGEQYVALDCLRYLSYTDFDLPSADGDDLFRRRQKYHFLIYAAKHWSRHVLQSDSQIDLADQILSYIDHERRFSAEEVWQRERHDGYAGIWQTTPFRDPNRGGLRRDPPLHTAAAHDLGLIVRRLISDRSGDVNASNSFGESPLHRAADSGSRGALSELLQHGADIQKQLQKPAARTHRPLPLHLAAIGGHNGCVHEFAETAKMDMNIPCDRYNFTPLHLAAATSTRTVQALLEHGANASSLVSASPHYIERGPFTPLHFVMLWMMGGRRRERVRLLLDYNGDIHAKTGDGNTALHLAVCRAEDMTRYLLTQNADPHVKNNAGQTPISLACEKARLGWFESDRGLPDCELLNTAHPLHMALWKDEPELALKLVTEGHDLTVLDSNGRSPLEYAILAGHIPVLEHMLKKADVETIAPVVGGKLFEKLAWAAADYEPREADDWKDLVHTLRLLLPCRRAFNNDFSFVKARTKIGQYNKTLLIHAAEGGFVEMAGFLLECGADVNAKDIFGASSGSYARGNVKMLQLLIHYRFDLSMKHSDGKTLPQIVANDGSLASREYMADFIAAGKWVRAGERLSPS